MPRKSSQDVPAAKRRGHFLREWRKFRKMTQEEVAAELGEVVSSVSQLETGKQGYTQWKLEALARIYGAPPGELLSRNPLIDPPPPPKELITAYDELREDMKPRALELLGVLSNKG